MKYSVEAIEDGIATLASDSDSRIFINTKELPEEIKEGDIVIFDSNGYYVSENETQKKRNEVFAKQKMLFNYD